MKSYATLTPRETEITELLAWGASKKDISNILGIAVRTVENTARNIFTKTEVNAATELSAWWFCTKYGIPMTDNPIPNRIKIFYSSLKAKIIAVILLFMIVPKEVFFSYDNFRVPRRNEMRIRTRRSTRRDNNNYLII